MVEHEDFDKPGYIPEFYENLGDKEPPDGDTIPRWAHFETDTLKRLVRAIGLDMYGMAVWCTPRMVAISEANKWPIRRIYTYDLIKSRIESLKKKGAFETLKAKTKTNMNMNMKAKTKTKMKLVCLASKQLSSIALNEEMESAHY